ncbi:MAG: hypothetical protein KDD82_07875 [Planctomycetes bacterium]|nr:hypothetical protein [Planctomycetota bacterium]
MELSLRAELREGEELQVLEEQARCDASLSLRALTRTAEVRRGAAVQERYRVQLEVGDGGRCTLRSGEGAEAVTRDVEFPPGTVCGLTSRLLLPRRVEVREEATPLAQLDLEEARLERLQARWQAPSAEGTQRLIVGSEEFADTWGFVVDGERKLVEVLTPDDGLRWTAEPDEAHARKDQSWPADDPRHTVKAFLAAVEAGSWEGVEASVDWEALAAAFEESDVASLRERVRAALGDSHTDESLDDASLRVTPDGDARWVDAEGTRFRLAQGPSGWKIVGIETR